MTKELICIGCPLGCNLTAEVETGEDGGLKVLSVTGNTCPRGDAYARKELVSPTRIVTSTVRVAGGVHPMINVKTASDIPKDKIFEAVESLKNITVTAPVMIGDVIVKNVCGTGVDIIAAGNAARCR